MASVLGEGKKNGFTIFILEERQTRGRTVREPQKVMNSTKKVNKKMLFHCIS